MEAEHRNEFLKMVLKAKNTEITADRPQEGSSIAFTFSTANQITKKEVNG
jgi:hypothetical protein